MTRKVPDGVPRAVFVNRKGIGRGKKPEPTYSYGEILYVIDRQGTDVTPELARRLATHLLIVARRRR